MKQARDSRRKVQQELRPQLGAAFGYRAGFDEEWLDFLPITVAPAFFERVTRFEEFEAHFKKALAFGCKGDVLLLCLQLFSGYNTEEVPVWKSRADAEEETLPIPTRARKGPPPPDGDQRRQINRCFANTLRTLKEHKGVLIERARLTPPCFIFPFATASDSIEAEDALVALNRLLQWAQRLLLKEYGNFETVKNAGMVIPCIYVEEVVQRCDSRSRRRLGALAAVAGLLNMMQKGAEYDSKTLRLYCKRFASNYPKQYKEIVLRLSTLDASDCGSTNEWRRLFTAEHDLRLAQRRRR